MARERGFFRWLRLRFDKASAQRVQEETADALERAGKQGAQALEEQLQQGGRKASRALVKSLTDEYRRTIARARIDLAKGLIDTSRFDEIRRVADQTFNRGLVAGMERLRAEGNLTESQFVQLTNRLKRVGDVGESSGERTRFSWTRVRAAIGAAIVAIVGSRVVQYLRDSASAAVETARSFLRLSATSKLYNVEQSELIRLAQIGRRELHLSARVANTLASTTARFAALAGDASLAQQLLNRALDLGAAQGLAAAEVGEALELTLRGQDEGLDKLIQRNPSAVYAEWAEKVGKSASKLTETEKRLAIVNTLIEQGRKVQGEYGRQLETDVGRLDRFNTLLQNSREEIGAALIPVLVQLADFLEGPLVSAVDVAAGALEHLGHVLESEADRNIRILEELGATAAALEAKRELAIEKAGEQQKEAADQAREAAMDLAKLLQFEELPGIGMQRQAEIRARPFVEELLDPRSLTLLREAAEIEQQLKDFEEGRIELTVGEQKHLLNKKRALDEILAALEREEAARRRIAEIERTSRAARTDAATDEGEADTETSTPARPVLPPARTDVGATIPQGMDLQGIGFAQATSIFDAELDRLANRWLETNALLVSTAENTAFGIVGSFRDAFGLLYDDIQNVGDAAEALLRGVAGAALGGVAEYASGKVKENIALAIEETAKGIAASANPFMAAKAPVHFAAAKAHALSALKWGLLAGAAGAGQGAIAGGGSGGQSGGIPSGAADPAARALEGGLRSRMEVHVYIDPLNPSDPAYQSNVYSAERMARERFGEDADVQVHPRTSLGATP